MEMHSILFKTNSGTLMNVETAKRGGFPRFEIYYRNSFFNPKECEAKIRAASVARRMPFPKGVTISLITPQGDISGCGNLDLALALAALCDIKTEFKVLAASSLNSKGECVSCDIIPRSLARICAINGIWHAILGESSREKMEAEASKDPDLFKNLRIAYAKDVAQARALLAAMENDHIRTERLARKEKPARHEESGQPSDARTARTDRMSGSNAANDPFFSVAGLDECKRMIAIALAGRHNLLILGPKGCAKTHILNLILEMDLPDREKSEREREENVMILKSIGIDAGSDDGLVRMIDESSIREMLKSRNGNAPKVIENNGKVLLADDISGLSKRSMFQLKGILGSNTLAFGGGRYPLGVSLVAASRLCGCGKAGSRSEVCECSSSSLRAYWRNLKEILMDCFDMTCVISESDRIGAKGIDARRMIMNADEMQKRRYGADCDISFNSDLMKSGESELRADALSKAIEAYGSGMGIRNALKAYCVARTLADCDGRDEISDEDLSSSLLLTKSLWR